MSDPARVFIGLGGNLGNIAATLDQALLALNNIPQTRLVRQSRYYQTSAWGNTEQPAFINAVAQCDTHLAPLVFLSHLLSLEQHFGRERSATQRWQPRSLDLDILLFAELQMDSIGLTVPHPHMHARGFVLVPLAEIAPTLEIPGVGNIQSCLAALDVSDIKVWNENNF
jgi:2-amino-4-hydroxy-6-hydroxymethyldihydropteridine diphosphokinase